MTHKLKHVRPGLTAIAAAALSATPIVAQDAAPAPDPVADTVVETPTATADPLAPEPAVEPAAREPAAAKSKAAAPSRRTAAKAPAANRAATRSSESASAVPASPSVTPPPVAADPVPQPAAPPAPAAQAAARSTPVLDIALPGLENLDREAIEEALPFAGAAGVGLLALAGLGLVRRRRRRREEQQWMEQAYAAQAAAAPIPSESEPAFVRPAQPVPAAAVLKGAPRTKLPNGFDLSRFGPHVQAAYLGPTPDNPSYSLKYRLRRAAAMDQRERSTGRAAVKPPETPKPKPAAPQWSSQNPSFMLRRSSDQPVRRPAYQK